jgi:hypothetical protein
MENLVLIEKKQNHPPSLGESQNSLTQTSLPSESRIRKSGA